MKDLLVGSTGFVGGNLKRTHDFEAECHSTDISDYYGSEPELCVYAGVPAAMYLANSDPNADLTVIKQALKNIKAINPQKLVLISTVAVYVNPKAVDEHTPFGKANLNAYGRNRAFLEKMIRKDFPECVIIRLPALYGEGLKKNFLYDIHTIIPSILQRDKYMELSSKSDIIRSNYVDRGNGLFEVSKEADRKELRAFFEASDFNALSFTDSRSRYQFYNLGRLWNDICQILKKNIKIMNLVTPPILAADIYRIVTGRSEWKNKCKTFFDYDVRTAYAGVLGGADGYICGREEEIKDIVSFMDAWKVKEG